MRVGRVVARRGSAGLPNARSHRRGTWGRLLLATALGGSVLLGGCRYQETNRLTWGLERMINQRKEKAFGATNLFSDGMVMRAPPAGTVPRERPYLSTSPIATGARADQPLREIPFRLTPALLQRGRNRFEIYCAPCHGLNGTGVSRVAAAMPLRHPPNLTGTLIRGLPVGRIYQVVAEGFGLMPSYQRQLSVQERWAVVAYVRALQLASRIPLAELPPEMRDELQRQLGGAEGATRSDSVGAPTAPTPRARADTAGGEAP